MIKSNTPASPISRMLRALGWLLLTITLVWTALAINASKYFHAPGIFGVLYSYRFAFEVLNLPEAKVPPGLTDHRKLSNQELNRIASIDNKVFSRSDDSIIKVYYEIFSFNNSIYTNTNISKTYIIDKNRICTYSSGFECNYFFVDKEGQLYKGFLYKGEPRFKAVTLQDRKSRELNITDIKGTARH